MSSENSTEPAGSRRDALQPWQLFTLAGLVGATVVVALSTGETPAGVILLSLTIFAAAGVGATMLRMLGPFVGVGAAAPVRAEGGRTRASLDREKVLALRAIKELEFDRAMGKVSEQDFAEVGARLRVRAARILRQLDAGNVYAARIENELRTRLGTAPAPPAPRRADPAPAGGAACARCGTPNDGDARFCKHCGARVEGGA